MGHACANVLPALHRDMASNFGSGYHIWSQETSMYLTVENHSREEKAKVNQCPLMHPKNSNIDSQIWYVFPVDADRYLIANKRSGLLLGPADINMMAGSLVEQNQTQANSLSRQTWQFRQILDSNNRPFQTVQNVANQQYLYFNFSEFQEGMSLVRLQPLLDLPNLALQLWSFQELPPQQLGMLPPKLLAHTYCSVNDIGPVIAMKSPNSPNRVKTDPILIGSAVIPFPLVLDQTVSRPWQAAESPYYYLSRYGYWEIVFSYRIGDNRFLYPTVKTVPVGVTTRNAEDVVRILGISVGFGPSYGLTGMLQIIRDRIAYSLQLEFQEGTQMCKDLVVQVKPEPSLHPRALSAIWFRNDHYVLRRIDGSAILSWIVRDPSKSVVDHFPY